MTHVSAWDIIKDTFDVFESESKWTKGEFARGSDGFYVDPSGEKSDICSFCILGSFLAQKSAYEMAGIDLPIEEEQKAVRCIIMSINFFKEESPNMGVIFDEVMGQYRGVDYSARKVVEFNDSPATTFDEVKKVGNLALIYAE